ncbi:MAG TPA: hypothetical protein VGT02_08225 [Methylomirabilota bacterium]|jgi:hypothetical protein|nr:hypothetical protein [Methylomirabilota bacterium]
MSRWLVTAAFLLLSVGTGVAIVLAAVGILPVDERDFGAPRWIVAGAGCVFIAMGACVLLVPWAATETWRGLLGGAFTLVFVTAGAIFLTWAALSGAEGRSTLSVAGLPIPLPERVSAALDRTFVVFCAALMDTITVVAWWAMARYLWRAAGRGAGAR